MRAAFVVVLVLVFACNPVSCCTCYFRRPIPALASVLCLTPFGVLPVCSPSLALFPPGLPGGAHASVGLGGDMAAPCYPRLRRCWRLGVSNHLYRPLAIPFRALDVIAKTRYESLGQHLIIVAIPRAGAVSRKMLRNYSGRLLHLPPASPLPLLPATSVYNY